MPITLRCPKCSRPLRVGDHLLGKRVKCPKCAHVFVGKLKSGDLDKPASGEAAPSPRKGSASRPVSTPAASKALPRKPAKKTTLAPSIPEDAPDFLDENLQVPSGATIESLPEPKPAQVKKKPRREDPDVTSEHTPAPDPIDKAMGHSGPVDNTHDFMDDPDSSDDDTSIATSPSALSKSSSKNKPAMPFEMPKSLGGYEILKELGRGGMGRVLLARQKSLDRLVALKVMNPERGKDAAFVARFMREAFAAAQLTHHHVVQIYDIGTEQGLHFFSMEFIKGESLMNLIQREGKLDPEVAVGYILQAARGLKFGHDLGMVHRDIKPDNLLLNDQGIVKVADLGLVKLANLEDIGPGAADLADGKLDVRKGLSQVTRIGQAMGTPSYMAPEQARNAIYVDHRADIYSLGCTLYVMLTGKPPFEGKTAVEVLTKHATAPVIPPDVIVKRVPKTLSAILTKMLAKKPDERYQDMGEVIQALEKYLGIQQAGAFSPKEDHANVLEVSVNKFNAAPRVTIRRGILLAFASGCAAVFVMCLLMRWLWLAAGVLGLPLITPFAYFLIQGFRERTFLFRKAREWLLDMDWIEWLYVAGATVLLFVLLYLFQLLLLWSVMGFLALAAAISFYLLVDRQLAAERQPYVTNVEKLLRSLRLQGLEEQALRQFIAKYSGKNWEEMYEVLFGYEAKIQARDWLRGEAAHRLNQHAAWRDPLVRWFDTYRRSRKEKRERKLLQALEAKALEEQGINKSEAKQKAAQVASVMVSQAAKIQKQAEEKPSAADADKKPRPSMKQLLETVEHPDTAETLQDRKPLSAVLAELAIGMTGARFRFIAGSVLLTACALWLYQNKFLEGDRLLDQLSDIAETGAWSRLDFLGEPLYIPFMTGTVGTLFQNFYVGIAGAILMLSAFFGRWKPGLVAWPAALILFLGPHLGFIDVGFASPGLISLAIGMTIVLGALVVRWLLKRRRASVIAPAAPSLDTPNLDTPNQSPDVVDDVPESAPAEPARVKPARAKSAPVKEDADAEAPETRRKKLQPRKPASPDAAKDVALEKEPTRPTAKKKQLKRRPAQSDEEPQ